MTRPYTRACRQTNFSEGGFVNKVPFLFYFFLFLFRFFLLSFLFLVFVFLPFCPFPSGSKVIWGDPSDYTGETGSRV